MKTRLFILCLIVSGSVFGQNFWTSTSLNQKELKDSKAVIKDQNLYSVDLVALAAHLENVPERENFRIQSNHTLEFPNLDGKFEKFYIAEASNFAPGLQSQYPNIRSYRGVSVSNAGIQIAFSVSPAGVQSMRFEPGVGTTFIETATVDNSVYLVKPKSVRDSEWTCTTPDEILEDELTNRALLGEPENLNADDQTLRDFKLALSSNGEYTQYHGGTVAGALAGMNATMTRVNSILERDMAVRLTIIENNADVIYTNPNSDPYSPATSSHLWNNQLQNTLTSVIGDANYDIGHLLGSSNSTANIGSGNAGCIGCICGPGKGRGYTFHNYPEGDRFDIDYVIHELGHQLGANHTFSRFEASGVNYEPGSGSTIMGYAGITYPQTNVQAFSDDYFHSGSIRQITTNVKSKTCPTTTIISNQTPVADAGQGYTIPVGTPFILTGSATDADGDPLTYTWEQTDSSPSSYNDFNIGNPNIPNGPIVRSIAPSTSPVRYIPSFDRVKSGSLTSPFESVSNVARNMNFAFQVRDNNPGIGQTSSGTIRVGVTSNGGPFKITSPTAESSVATGEAFEVTWDVALTNASPVNTQFVDIYLSTDNAENFTLMASNVENNGSYMLDIPADATSEAAYIMVKSVGNIFYALSSKFYIGYNITIQCETFDATGLPREIPDGTNSYAVGQIMVPDLGTVEELRVSVDITHTYVGDLQIALNSPSPANLNFLWDRQCGPSDDINLTFADNAGPVNCSETASGGTAASSTPLSTYEGYQTQGTWLVGVRDGAVQDSGTFNAASITFCNIVATPMSVENVASDKMMVNVYPNPSNGIFNIKMDLEAQGVSLGVYDMTGKQVHTYQNKNASGSFHHELKLESLPQGVYVLQITNGNQIISKKLMVK